MRLAKRFLMLAVLAALVAAYAVPAIAAEEAKPDYFFHDIVDVNFVKKYAKMPKAENVMIIDSRPYMGKYVSGYIPTAVSIPDSEFDKRKDELPADKNALLIFYCQGPKCKLSHKSAKKAEALGYTNVKVYAGGYPDWVKYMGNYKAYAPEHLKSLMEKGEPYMLIDSRPHKKFLEGSIPSALPLPYSQFNDLKGYLPADKSAHLIFFCGGFHCKLSHKSAIKAKEQGYGNVAVMEAGYPGWKELYGAGSAVEVKSGGVEGSIDIAQFEKILADNPDSIMIVDVRDKDEFEAGHFANAVNIPVDKLEKQIASLPADKPIVFVCSTGARSGESFYMVLDQRPELKQVYYLEAETVFKKDGSYTIKPNK